MERPVIIACVFVFLGICCTAFASADGNQPGEISASIGGTVSLDGSMPGTDMVYLALTSSKLPPNGVRMDNIKQKVQTGIPSTFTQIPVTGGNWHYTWNTGDVSGALPEGRYIVYICDRPVGKDDYSSQVRYEIREVALAYRGYQDAVTTTPVSRQTSPQVTENIPLTATIQEQSTTTTIPAETEPRTPPATRASNPSIPLVIALLFGTGMYIAISRRRT